MKRRDFLRGALTAMAGAVAGVAAPQAVQASTLTAMEYMAIPSSGEGQILVHVVYGFRQPTFDTERFGVVVAST
jgi:hypothetical protein